MKLIPVWILQCQWFRKRHFSSFISTVSCQVTGGGTRPGFLVQTDNTPTCLLKLHITKCSMMVKRKIEKLKLLTHSPGTLRTGAKTRPHRSAKQKQHISREQHSSVACPLTLYILKHTGHQTDISAYFCMYVGERH